MKEASKAMRRRAQTNEYDQYFKGHGVDIGCGDDNIVQFADRFGMTSCRGYDLQDGNAQHCLNLEDQSFDFLHSSHCLEHMENPFQAMHNWIRVVKTGGYLVITVPDEVMYEKRKWPPVFNKDHKWSFRLNDSPCSDRSLDAMDFFRSFGHVRIVSVKYLNDGYYEDGTDLTAIAGASHECAIEVVLQKISHPYKSVRNWALNGFAFVLNSLAMGDVIAAVPVIKYNIERFYADGQMPYRVVAKKMFRPLFPFVDDAHWHDFEDAANDWGIPKNWAVGVLNQKNSGTNIIRSTPKTMLLGQYAALKLTDRMLPVEVLNYVPLEKVDISKFNTDFSKAVIFVSTYRDYTRSWRADHMLEVAKFVKSIGLLPVFIGKTDMNLDTKIAPKTSLPDDVSEYGLDLRNATTIPELYTIMSEAKIVLGMDSGPIHLAGCSSVPIVCGYTSVDASVRIPVRKDGPTVTIKPRMDCASCETNWASHFHNFEECFFGHAKCVDDMLPERFIHAIGLILSKEK